MKINILRPFIPLVIIIILFSATAKFGLAKISEVRSKISQAQREERVLSQKLSVLSDVEVGVSNDSSLVSSTIPNRNPSLIVASQIKVEAGLLGLTPLNIKSGTGIEDKSGLSRVDVNFDIEGQRSTVLEFLKKIEGFAPITLVEKVKLNEVGGVARAQVTVKTFFAELPKKLPALGEALNDLTSDEKKILTEASGLRQPLFVNFSASTPGERPDPFSQ